MFWLGLRTLTKASVGPFKAGWVGFTVGKSGGLVWPELVWPGTYALLELSRAIPRPRSEPPPPRYVP